MVPKQSIDWKNEWFPIDDVTYLNFAAHAAIPRVASTNPARNAQLLSPSSCLTGSPRFLDTTA
jgi:hypothetical protein